LRSRSFTRVHIVPWQIPWYRSRAPWYERAAGVLNDAKIKAAKPRDKAYKLADAEQLYLYVSPAGGRVWRMNYTYGRNDQGKPQQKTLTIGPYPAITLLGARARRDEAKQMLRDGKDPAVERRLAEHARVEENENTLEAVGNRWFELKSGWSLDLLAEKTRPDGTWSLRDAAHWIKPHQGGWSTVHADDVLRSLRNDAYPAIGKLPITAIKAPRLLDLLNKVERRGAIEAAHRLRQRCSAIFVYGIAAGVCESDPAASLGKALKQKPPEKKQPAIIDRIRDNGERLAAVRQMLRDCEDQRCRAGTKFALRLLALTAVRPGEIAGARWQEFEGLDGPAPLWRIPAARMKGDLGRKAEEDGDHLVPLAAQSVAVLNALRSVSGNLALLFPSERHLHRQMSENTLRALLIRAGYYQRHVPHGFRATFSTIMNERPDRQDGDRAVIDLMLAHVPGNKVEGAYNRAAYMDRRRELAQEWADILLGGFPDPAVHLGQPMRWADISPKRPRKPMG
jgi:integrase